MSRETKTVFFPMEQTIDRAVSRLNTSHPIYREFPSLTSSELQVQVLVIKYWEREHQVAKDTENIATSPDQIKRDIKHVIENGYKARLPLHGGCLKCVAQELHGLSFCVGCRYSFAEWDKPDKSIKAKETCCC